MIGKPTSIGNTIVAASVLGTHRQLLIRRHLQQEARRYGGKPLVVLDNRCVSVADCALTVSILSYEAENSMMKDGVDTATHVLLFAMHCIVLIAALRHAQP